MFSDQDDLPNAAATVPAPQAETAPNSAAPRAEHAEARDAGHEPPVRGTSEQTGASTDSASVHAQAEANREAHAADAESATADEEAAGSEEMSKLLEQYDEKQEAATSH